MAFNTAMGKLVFTGTMAWFGLGPAEPRVAPFPLLDLSKARTGADVLAAIEVVTDKIKAKNV